MASGLFGTKTKKDPMRQSSAMTTVYLLQQNQIFEQFMRAKVDDLETRVAAQQARLSANEEQAEKEVWADLDGLDDIFGDVSARLDTPTPTPARQAAPTAATTAPHPAANLGVMDSVSRRSEVSSDVPSGVGNQPEEAYPVPGEDEDTPVDILALMMNNDGDDGDEMSQGDNGEGEAAYLAPTVATPPTNPPTQVTQIPAVATPSPPITVSPQPPPSALAGAFNVDSEFEPLFANRFSPAAPALVDPTRLVQPVQTVKAPADPIEPTRPVQPPAAIDEAGADRQISQGEQTATLHTEWNTHLGGGEQQLEDGLPDWDFTLLDETEGEQT